jgi:hypothetical protein
MTDSRCNAVHLGKYSGSSGLGPTKLISPLSTFQSCGNSSRLVLRRNLPSPVSRCSSAINFPDEARPGITGWAQVNGRNRLTWEQKLQADVWYVNNRTLWLDLSTTVVTKSLSLNSV